MQGQHPESAAPPGPRLLDLLWAAMRLRHSSLRTEESYAALVRRGILFHGKRHPLELGAAEGNVFLTHLAVQGHVRSVSEAARQVLQRQTCP